MNMINCVSITLNTAKKEKLPLSFRREVHQADIFIIPFRVKRPGVFAERVRISVSTRDPAGRFT